MSGEFNYGILDRFVKLNEKNILDEYNNKLLGKKVISFSKDYSEYYVQGRIELDDGTSLIVHYGHATYNNKEHENLHNLMGKYFEEFILGKRICDISLGSYRDYYIYLDVYVDGYCRTGNRIEIPLYHKADINDDGTIKEKAGRTSTDVNTRIFITSAKDKDLIGITGRITHPFKELMEDGTTYLAGVHVEQKGIFENDKLNLEFIHDQIEYVSIETEDDFKEIRVLKIDSIENNNIFGMCKGTSCKIYTTRAKELDVGDFIKCGVIFYVENQYEESLFLLDLGEEKCNLEEFQESEMKESLNNHLFW